MRFIITTLALCFSLNVASADSTKDVPKELSQILGKGLPGTTLKMEDLKNKVVLVDFWASWCEPCKEALPIYNKLYQKHKTAGLIIIGVNEDDEPKDRDAFLKAHPVSFPMFHDTDGKWAKELQIQALPTLYVFGKDKKAIKFYRGFNGDSKKMAELEKLIQQELAKK